MFATDKEICVGVRTSVKKCRFTEEKTVWPFTDINKDTKIRLKLTGIFVHIVTPNTLMNQMMAFEHAFSIILKINFTKTRLLVILKYLKYFTNKPSEKSGI